MKTLPEKLFLVLVCGAVSLGARAADQIAAGKALTEKYSCATCHGKDFNTPIDPSYPKLAGQHKEYLAHALTAYKRGDGANGRNNAIMTAQVKLLNDKEIEALAAYLHSLPTKLVVER